MGATLARSAAIGQRAIAISAGPPLRRGALRGAHGNPGRARALAWNRVCGAIDFVFCWPRLRRAAIGRWACEKWVSQVRFWVSQQKVKIAA